jgi:hypothetical protein
MRAKVMAGVRSLGRLLAGERDVAPAGQSMIVSDDARQVMGHPRGAAVMQR